MSGWISSSAAKPSLPGWYPTLSDWRTRTRHPGAKKWLGTKWATTCPERIVFFATERFDDPCEASSRAYDIPDPAEPVTNCVVAVERNETRLAAAAG